MVLELLGCVKHEVLNSNSNIGVRDETVLKDYIKRFTPLTYGNEGRVKFIKTIDPLTDCPSTNVTGTVFCKLQRHSVLPE